MLRKLKPGQTRNFRVVAAFGLLLFGLRVAIGLLLILLEATLGEADLLLLFDIPTVAVYLILGRAFDYKHNIENVYDVRFFVTGAITWLVLGFVAGGVVLGFQKRRVRLAQSR